MFVRSASNGSFEFPAESVTGADKEFLVWLLFPREEFDGSAMSAVTSPPAAAIYAVVPSRATP